MTQTDPLMQLMILALYLHTEFLLPTIISLCYLLTKFIDKMKHNCDSKATLIEPLTALGFSLAYAAAAYLIEFSYIKILPYIILVVSTIFLWVIDRRLYKNGRQSKNPLIAFVTIQSVCIVGYITLLVSGVKL